MPARLPDVKSKSAQTLGTELRLLEVQAAGTGKAPWTLSFHNITNLGTVDPTMYIGYNQSANGAKILAGENSLSLGFEADYAQTAEQHMMEFYLQYDPANGVSTGKRPIMIQVDRATDITDTLILMGAVLRFHIDDGSGVTGTPAVRIDPGRIYIEPYAGVDGKIAVQAATGRSSSLVLGYSGTDSALSLAAAAADIGTLTVGGNHVLTMYGARRSICVGGAWDNTATIVAQNSVSSNRCIVARGTTAQEANLLEVQDVNSAVLSTFSENGYFTTRKVAAPADAELVAGEMALWFDATNGAGKLMVKAKTANGTVATAAMALT